MSDARDPVLPLRIEDVRYAPGGHPLLHGMSAEIDGDGVTAIIGPNGAGKSLLLRLCRGLLQPSGGRIRWAGRAPAELGMRIGYVPQHPTMLRRSVRGNLAFAARRAAPRGPEREQRIRDGLALAGLEGRERAPARLLSGGERQRLAIARAWAQRPAALLLDEPSAHLDPSAAVAVERTVATIRDAGTKVVLTTHDLNQARRLADDVLLVHAGRIVEHGAAATFFDAPRTEAARGFLRGDLLAA